MALPWEGSIASILVTAGPTHEHLDDVRYLANGSSGRMGYALAAAGAADGHDVCLVSGPVALDAPDGVRLVPVVSALEMQAAVDAELAAGAGRDLIFAVAAVADYRPATCASGKPKKQEGPIQLDLVPNPDILLGLGTRKAAGELRQILVGFALEAGSPEEVLAKGRAKLVRKQLDMIVVNHVAAMGATDNQVTLLTAAGGQHDLPRAAKQDLAVAILAHALDLCRPSQD